MTSNTQIDSVYMELCNAFPMVDLRILKAVAFENHTDYDAAFHAVVDDVLPHIPEGTNLTDLNQEDLSSQLIARAEAAEYKIAQEVNSILSSDSLLVPKHAANPMPELSAQECLQKVSEINNTDELISLCKGLAYHLNVVPEKISRFTSIHDDLEGKFMSANLNGGNTQSSFMAEHMVPLSEANGFPAFVFPVLEKPDENLVSGSRIDSVELVDCACESQDGPCMAVSGIELEDLIGVSVSVLPQGTSEMNWSDIKNKMPGFGIAFSPSQTKIQVLELSIEEAKTIKQTLRSSLEAIRNTIREVEEREKAVGKAEEEAFEGGPENLSRGEELKTMLQEAKKDLDKHVGEIYDERSILATEAMELQSRLANLTEERDKALCILDEMHHSVESRLSAADEEIRKSEEEKLQEENSIKKYFNEQEAIMDEIVHAAKFLKLEAEENSKLQALLVDRGRTVDMLQREIGVICQDVKSLKCKFDEWVPLGESVSSSRESCILASSTSTKRSISSQSLSDQEAPSEPRTPAEQHTDFDEDGWEFV